MSGERWGRRVHARTGGAAAGCVRERREGEGREAVLGRKGRQGGGKRPLGFLALLSCLFVPRNSVCSALFIIFRFCKTHGSALHVILSIIRGTVYMFVFILIMFYRACR